MLHAEPLHKSELFVRFGEKKNSPKLQTAPDGNDDCSCVTPQLHRPPRLGFTLQIAAIRKASEFEWLQHALRVAVILEQIAHPLGRCSNFYKRHRCRFHFIMIDK